MEKRAIVVTCFSDVEREKMKALVTTIKFAVYGFVGLAGGLVIGLVTAAASGANTPQATGPIIAWSLGIGLLLGLAMGAMRKGD